MCHQQRHHHHHWYPPISFALSCFSLDYVREHFPPLGPNWQPGGRGRGGLGSRKLVSPSENLCTWFNLPSTLHHLSHCSATGSDKRQVGRKVAAEEEMLPPINWQSGILAIRPQSKEFSLKGETRPGVQFVDSSFSLEADSLKMVGDWCTTPGERRLRDRSSDHVMWRTLATGQSWWTMRQTNRDKQHTLHV